MTASKQHAQRAAAALAKLLRPDVDAGEVTAILQNMLDLAARERDKSAKAKAREQAARLLAASPAVIYSFKARGDFAPTFISDNIETLFGYASGEYLDNPNFWRERVHPDDLARVDAEVNRLFDVGRQTLEYRFRRRDGSYCWVNDEQHLVRDDAGAPLEVVGSWSDIGARKAAEDAEDAARARLSVLLETAPSVIYSFKARDDYAPTFISENIKRLLGYCPEKYLEHADFWRSHVHPEDLAAVEAEQARLFDKGRHVAEYRFRKRNGTYIWVSDDQYLLRDDKGEPTEIVGSWSNITARKAAEEASNASRARFDMMLHSAPAVVYSFAATGNFTPTFVSDNIQRVLGYEPDDYLKQPDFWRSRVHPEDLAAVEAEQVKLFEDGRHAVRISLPQGRRRLLLGQRRADARAGPEWQSARGDRHVERGDRAQDRRAGRPPAERAASDRRHRDDLRGLLPLRRRRPVGARQSQLCRAVRFRRGSPGAGLDL